MFTPNPDKINKYFMEKNRPGSIRGSCVERALSPDRFPTNIMFDRRRTCRKMFWFTGQWFWNATHNAWLHGNVDRFPRKSQCMKFELVIWTISQSGQANMTWLNKFWNDGYLIANVVDVVVVVVVVVAVVVVVVVVVVVIVCYWCLFMYFLEGISFTWKIDLYSSKFLHSHVLILCLYVCSIQDHALGIVYGLFWIRIVPW